MDCQIKVYPYRLHLLMKYVDGYRIWILQINQDVGLYPCVVGAEHVAVGLLKFSIKKVAALFNTSLSYKC